MARAMPCIVFATMRPMAFSASSSVSCVMVMLLPGWPRWPEKKKGGQDRPFFKSLLVEPGRIELPTS
jgi:hypothetical protein